MTARRNHGPGRRTVIALAIAFGNLSSSGCDRWLTKPSLYSSVPVVVTARNGDPVPGAGLTLFTGQRPMGYAETGSDGRFTFTRVPQGLYGVAAVPPPGFKLLEDLVRSAPTNYATNIRVSEEATDPVRLTFLKVGPGTVSVRAVAQDGRPVVGLTVYLYDPVAVRATKATDANGRAVFDAVPFGVYGVTIDRSFYGDFPARADGSVVVYDDIIVDEGSRDSVSFTLQRCSGTLRVLATDQNNAPVPGATLTFYSAIQVFATRTTSADGRATADGPCGVESGISITAPPGYSVASGRNSSFFDAIKLSNGQTLDFTFRLQKLP